MSDAVYTCRYCRLPSDASGVACPNCGAPIDVREAVTDSGWTKQPPIVDLARLQFGRSRVQITGKQVPVADFALADQDWVYFAHQSLLWTDPATRLQSMSMAGGWRRMIAGMPIIMMQALGAGRIALSDNHAGEIVALPLPPHGRLWVREHRFLVADGRIGYTWEPAQIWFRTGSGDDRETHYPLGQVGDVFAAGEQPGLLLLHAPGNVFIRDLAPGQTLLIQPSALLYRDMSVQAHLHLEYPRGGTFFGLFSSSFSYRNVWLRLIGPGRVAVQSIFERPEASEAITSSSPATSSRW